MFELYFPENDDTLKYILQVFFIPRLNSQNYGYNIRSYYSGTFEIRGNSKLVVIYVSHILSFYVKCFVTLLSPSKP